MAFLNLTGMMRQNANLRKRRACSRAAFESQQPRTSLFAQLREIDSPEGLRKRLEPTQGFAKQRNCAANVSGLYMVEGRRGLNQRLQKALLWFFQAQPHALPMFVGNPELRVPIAPQSLSKRPGSPFERHTLSIDELTTRFPSLLVTDGVPIERSLLDGVAGSLHS